jgi:transcriptional regulator with XRE-family HTH domain
MIKYKSGLNLANLKNVIKQAGMQSKDVADQLGVRPETVSRWINGGAVPGFDQAEHLAEILNVSVSDIMFRNRGLLIAGTRDFHGNVTMYDSLEPKKYLPVPGADMPEHRFCLKVVTHLPEDQHSYDSFSDVYIKQKVVHKTTHQMRSIMKIHNGPKEYIGKILMGVIYPMPLDKDNKQKYTINLCKTSDAILDVELEWATPMLSRFYNRDDSTIMDLIDPDNNL